MFRSSLLLACACLMARVGVAQTEVEATDIVGHPFSMDFASGGKLRLHVRSGEINGISSPNEPRTRT